MAEIRRSPVKVGSSSHYLQGFSTIPGGDRRISEPSTVLLFGVLLELNYIGSKRVKQSLALDVCVP